MCFLRYYGNSCKTDWIAWVSRILPEVHYNEARNLWGANGVERYWNKKKRIHLINWEGKTIMMVMMMMCFLHWFIREPPSVVKKTQTFRVNFLFLFVSVRIFEYFPIDVCLFYDIVHASRQFLKKQKKRQLEFRRTRT